MSAAATFQLATAPDGLALSGALVFATAADALTQARAALRDAGAVTLDLRGIERADSAGLAVLLALAGDARRQARTLRLAHAPAGLRALAHLGEVEGLLGIETA